MYGIGETYRTLKNRGKAVDAAVDVATGAPLAAPPPVITTNYDASNAVPVAPTARGKARLQAIIESRKAIPLSEQQGMRPGMTRGKVR